jgi:hypothetical protein
MKKNKRIILSTLFCFLPIIYGLYFYNKLPDVIPTHFDFSGNVNGYTNKNIFVFVLPILLAIINIFLCYIIKLDPKNKDKNTKIINIMLFILPVLFNVIFILILFTTLDYGFNKSFANIFIGIFFITIGNYFPKFSQNYTIGIRIPWTMNDEENWYKTHRFASKLYIILGILFIFSKFIQNDDIRFYITIMLFSIFILPLVYSYVIYKNKK